MNNRRLMRTEARERKIKQNKLNCYSRDCSWWQTRTTVGQRDSHRKQHPTVRRGRITCANTYSKQRLKNEKHKKREKANMAMPSSPRLNWTFLALKQTCDTKDQKELTTELFLLLRCNHNRSASARLLTERVVFELMKSTAHLQHASARDHTENDKQINKSVFPRLYLNVVFVVTLRFPVTATVLLIGTRPETVKVGCSKGDDWEEKDRITARAKNSFYQPRAGAPCCRQE